MADPQQSVSPPKGEKTRPIRVLFLCTHNSARSQMAEGLLRGLGGDRFAVQSAGTEPSQVHPLAIEAMATHGIDIASHRSKHLVELTGERFDYVVTVCDRASEACPVFPGAPERIHWSLADPSAVEGSKAEKRAAFKRAANDLKTRIQYLIVVAERGFSES